MEDRKSADDITGIVFEIERYALNEGPGIRTLVFLKGCQLRCQWCSNPESQQITPQLVHWKNKCIGCKECLAACPQNALSRESDGLVIDRGQCMGCGTCVTVCNSEAMVLIGKSMTPAEVVHEVLKDRHFYRKSGGGVTFSGGEPLRQLQFLKESARLCKQHRLHTAVETSGCAPWEHIEELCPYIDLFLYDFKEMDPDLHQKFTGVSNVPILENFKRLVERKKDVVARVPVIPKHNERYQNFQLIIDFLSQYAPGLRVDLLPYHRLGRAKYERLAMPYPLNGIVPPSRAKMEKIRKFFAMHKFQVSIGG